MIRRIPQRDGDDCVACVLAMVMGHPHTYETVSSDIAAYESGAAGKHEDWWPEYLRSKGFAVSWRKIEGTLSIRNGERGILRMKMPATGEGHVAAVDEDGVIFDPSTGFVQPMTYDSYKDRRESGGVKLEHLLLVARKQMTEDNLIQLYWAILERWGAQVDTYWTRTNYFAVFELAAIAGTWAVLDDKDITKGRWPLLFEAQFALVLAVVLTTAWIFSNLKSYDYHMYWWDVLDEIEKYDGWNSDPPNYVSAYETRRKGRPILSKVSYHFFTNWLVPITFFVIWVALVFGSVVHRWH